jgi:hypothetical protein
MNELPVNAAPYARIAAKLLTGPLSDDQKELWEDLLKYQIELTQYFEKITLDLIIDKRDGYAFLKQMEIDDKGTTIGLVRRIPLTYEQTLVCVLLREWLFEFESTDTETRNLYITPKQFRDRLEVFFKEKSNQLKFIRELNKYLNDVEKMGFIKMVNENKTDPDDSRYEVKRIIKARITNDELVRFKEMVDGDA